MSKRSKQQCDFCPSKNKRVDEYFVFGDYTKLHLLCELCVSAANRVEAKERNSKLLVKEGSD